MKLALAVVAALSFITPVHADVRTDEHFTGCGCVLGPIQAGVIQLIPNGGGSIIIVNRGTTQGLKVGMTGAMLTKDGKQVTFKITEVYPVRSKAVSDASAAELEGRKEVSINRF